MSDYIRRTWKDGDVITADGLNNLETGVTEAKQAAGQTPAHEHSAEDISSGTLASTRLPVVPIEKGGTGAATAAAALANLGAMAADAFTNAKIVEATDFDTLLEQGFYYFTGEMAAAATNSPYATAMNVAVFTTGTRTTQIATRYGESTYGEMKFRSTSTNTVASYWQEWGTVLTEKTVSQSALPIVCSILKETSGTDNLDATTTPLVLSELYITKPELYTMLGSNYAYVITLFYGGIGTGNSRMQLAISYTTGKMAMRNYYSSGWSAWHTILTEANFSYSGGTLTITT